MTGVHYLLIIINIIVITLAYMLYRTYKFTPKVTDEIEKITSISIDTQKVSQHLSAAIKFKTISLADESQIEWKYFDEFKDFLAKTYPIIHEKLSLEIIKDHSLLYKWEGKDPKKEAIALLSHMDVVPVMPGTEQDWEHGAFSGDIDENYVWGRGTLDMKGNLICVMEAVEMLLSQDFSPNCDVYLCFGHNEEIVSSIGSGAIAIVETLQERKVNLGLVVDEGGAIVNGSMFGLGEGKKIAAIGIGEKGYADIKITSLNEGGHSSQPPKINGLTQLGRLMVNLEKKPKKAKVTYATKHFFNTLGPHMGFVMRLMLSNLWITKPLVLLALSKSSSTNAMIRTTIVPTMAEGSPAGNVLPQTANINVNSRILQGEKISDVVDHIKKCSKGMDLDIDFSRGKEPSKIANIDTPEFAIMTKTIRELFGNVVVTPYLMTGGTDSCNYESLTSNIYRISPFYLGSDDMKRIHATNERIDKQSLTIGVRFFIRLLENYTK